MALGQRRYLAPAVRLIGVPQQVEGDGLDQRQAGNPLRVAPGGAQRDRPPVGMADEVDRPARHVEQRLDHAGVVRMERRAPPPGIVAPIAEKVEGQGAKAWTKVADDRHPGAACAGAAMQEQDRLPGSRLPVVAVAVGCLQATIGHGKLRFVWRRCANRSLLYNARVPRPSPARGERINRS